MPKMIHKMSVHFALLIPKKKTESEIYKFT